MKYFHPIVLTLAATLAAPSAQAEVQKFMNTCDGKLCPYYQIVLTPPDGWVVAPPDFIGLGAQRSGTTWLYSLIAAHPGCTVQDMVRLKTFASEKLRIHPEQVQIFTPTPSTMSSAMYYCETDALGRKLFCEKDLTAKERQKQILRKLEK